jgi:hypothetical protein
VREEKKQKQKKIMKRVEEWVEEWRFFSFIGINVPARKPI